MKHKPVNQMLANPDHLTPEQVAEYAVFNTTDNDSTKFRNICDLIVACEQAEKRRQYERFKPHLIGMILPILLAFTVLAGCGTKQVPALKNGDHFLLEYGYNVHEFYVTGSNGYGYYVKKMDWLDSDVIFMPYGDLSHNSFKIIGKPHSQVIDKPHSQVIDTATNSKSVTFDEETLFLAYKMGHSRSSRSWRNYKKDSAEFRRMFYEPIVEMKKIANK